MVADSALAPAVRLSPPQPPAPAQRTVEQIIRDIWPDNLEDRAIAIAYRESRFVPTAHTWCCYGIFEIYFTKHRSWLADYGITKATDLYDPVLNVTAAYALYQLALATFHDGWQPWKT